jgi:hypothetical protein
MDNGLDGAHGRRVHVHVVVVLKKWSGLVQIPSKFTFRISVFFSLFEIRFLRPRNGGLPCEGEKFRYTSCNTQVNRVSYVSSIPLNVNLNM